MSPVFVSGVNVMSDTAFKRFVRHHKRQGRGQYRLVTPTTANIKVRGTVTMRAFKSHAVPDLWFVKARADTLPASFIDAAHLLPMRLRECETNPLSLIGIAKNLCWLMGMDNKRIMEDMTSKDYQHLLDVFRDNFSNIVELENPRE